MNLIFSYSKFVDQSIASRRREKFLGAGRDNEGNEVLVFESEALPPQHGLSHEELHATFKKMEDDSSSFASCLADLWFRADSRNRHRIESTFADLIEEFKPVNKGKIL